MKRQKKYRIISENGEILLLTDSHFEHLLRTLGRLADGHGEPSQKQQAKQ